MDLILVVMVSAALVVSLYTGFRLFTILSRIRKESSKSFEVASQIQEAWERFAIRQDQERQRLLQRLDDFESSTADRVERFEKVATGTRERLIKLEEYLKQFFEVELKSVFDSFDKTVASVLGEMKTELLRGVDRIEEIQAVVDSRSFAQDRILDGEGSVYRLLAETGEVGAESQRGDPTSVETEVAQETDEQLRIDEADRPPMRMEEDETE